MSSETTSTSSTGGRDTLSPWSHYRVARRVSANFVRACGLVPAVLGSLALAGWILDIPLLRSGLPAAVEMKANTAVAVLSAGVALLLIAMGDRRPGSERRDRLANLLASGVALLGLATATQYITGIDLGIDEAIVRDATPRYSIPGRMSLYSAVALSLIGTALAILRVRRLRALANGLAGIAALIGLVMLTAHAWGTVRLRADDWAPAVAFTTAMALVLLGAGIWTAAHRFSPGRRSLRVLLDPMEKKIIGSFVGAIIALTSVGGLVYGAAAQYSHEIQRLAQVRQMRSDLTELYATVADAVFVQRTLVLSDAVGTDALLADRWLAQRRKLAREQNVLGSYPGLDDSGRLAIESLDRAVRGLGEALQQAVDIRHREGSKAAHAFLGSGRDAAAMAALRVAMARMDAIARGEEESSADLLRNSRERTVAYTVLALVIATSVLGAMFLAIRREMAARAGAERSMRRRSAEATAASRFLESLFQNIPHVIFVKDSKDLRYVRMNRAGEQLTGMTQAMIAGKTDYDFLPREEADFFVAKDREMLARKEILVIPEETIQTIHRGVRLLHTTKIPLIDDAGRVTHLVGIAEDVTEARATERQIQLLNEALNERAEALERVSRARSTFLAAMSHEIRTPMNGMLGTLELLSLGPLDDRQRKLLNVVSGSGQALLRIIDDILDFSKIEAGRLELREQVASLVGIVHEVQQIHSTVARDKGLRIAVVVGPDVAPAIWIDAVRLRQILNNFVSNAVKFTSQGQVEIRVVVLADQQDRQSIRLTVTDTGCGISAEEQARLFEPFVQAEAGMASASGTGLGLVISRRLAHLMGGAVHLASELGAGTTLSLELAVRKASPELMPQPGDGKAEDLRRMTERLRTAPSSAQAEAEGSLVLVVDDHPVNRLLLQQQLESLGYAADTAVDGVDGLAKWRSGRYGLVLTDCQMPRMNGYEFTRQIRQQESARGAPPTRIIACTAMALEGEREKCLAAGMDDIVFKPVDLRQLHDRLEQWRPSAGGEGLPRARRHAPAAVPSLAGPVDTDHVAATWGGDAGTIRSILDAYLESVREDYASLYEAMGRSDLDAVREVAHRMLGASGMVGAKGIAETCMLVTAASRGARWGELKLAMEALQAEYARLDAELGGLPVTPGVALD